MNEGKGIFSFVQVFTKAFLLRILWVKYLSMLSRGERYKSTTYIGRYKVLIVITNLEIATEQSNQIFKVKIWAFSRTSYHKLG